MAAVIDASNACRNALHYLFDPLCGWCYAAAPLIAIARTIPGMNIALHGGGMMTGTSRRAITPQWRDYVIAHDRRIAQLTGQSFGAAYFDVLLRDANAMMDSEPPTTAILAADQLGGHGPDMLDRLQHAHYVQGLRIADRQVLTALAVDLRIDAAAFGAAFDRQAGARTRQHIAASRELLARTGGQGFPWLVFERADGQMVPIELAQWLGRPDAWKVFLAESSPIASSPKPRPGDSYCWPDTGTQ
jgi:putative protein-disulfide isomerase